MRQLAGNPLIARTIATTTATSDTAGAEVAEGARQDEVDVADGEVEEDVEIRGSLLAKTCASVFYFSTSPLTDSFQRWSPRPTPEYSSRQQAYRWQ